MLSRVADSIYWMSRYIERAENVARLIDVNFNLILDMPSESDEQWKPLIMITGDEEAFAERYETFSRENVIRFLTFDKENPNSILSSLTAARENARSVREAVSSEMWSRLNEFYLMVRHPTAPALAEESPHEFFDTVRLGSQSLIGVAATTMTHNDGWHFGKLGRMLERADKTSRILDAKYFILLPTVDDVGTPLDDMQWTALLRSTSGFEMYRKKCGRIEPTRVVEFLVLDRQFPRSILYCVSEAQRSLHAISGTPTGMFANPAEQMLGQLQSELAFTGVDEIIARGLHEYMDGLQTRLNRVADGVFDTFFTMRPMHGAVTYR